MTEILSGHKVTSCPGRWIDVGTLKDPRAQICNKCRGHRQKPIHEVSEQEELTAEEALMDIFGAQEDPPLPRDEPMRIVWYVILSAAVGALTALIFNMLYAWRVQS